MKMFGQAWETWDAACTHFVREGCRRLGFQELLKRPAPAVASLPFVQSPTPLATVILVYLLIVGISFVFRTPISRSSLGENTVLRGLVQLHNSFLVCLSGYMCITALREAYANGYSFWGNDYNPKEVGMARITYIFYISKAYEFLDTVCSPCLVNHLCDQFIMMQYYYQHRQSFPTHRATVLVPLRFMYVRP
jgi:hypothetical protein